MCFRCAERWLQGTVICRSDRTALAVVEDVFGPVSAPMYLLRFSSQSTMEELLVKPGLSVFYPKVNLLLQRSPAHASCVADTAPRVKRTL